MKNFVRMLFLILIGIGLGFGQISHEVIQGVYIWPDGVDTTGKHFVFYDLYHPETHWLDLSDPATYVEDWTSSWDCIVWHSETGNFPDWQGGDTCIAFGSFDSAYAADPSGYGNNPNHKGYFWLFSDTLDPTVDPQYWTPNDTLWLMPQPLASQVNGDTGHIEISITNPPETRRADQTEYDVLGYWVVADTSGQGTPNSYDKDVGFFPVNGVAGDVTVCIDEVENYEDGQTVYWAYKLVARPDTTAKKSRQVPPGYSTYYLSMNSNPIVIVGKKENRRSVPKSSGFYIVPNPFTEKTEIRFFNTEKTELKIFDVCGKMVKRLSVEGSDHIVWDGTDWSGEKLPCGVYLIKEETKFNTTKKVIIQR